MRLYKQVLIIGSLFLLTSPLWLSCAQPSSTPQASPRTSPTMVLNPATVDTKAKEIKVTGSGFAPNAGIDITMGGTWRLKDTTVDQTDPSVLYVKTNAQGGFEGVFVFDRFVANYGLKPGTYPLKAIEHQIVLATVSLEVTQPK